MWLGSGWPRQVCLHSMKYNFNLLDRFRQRRIFLVINLNHRPRPAVVEHLDIRHLPVEFREVLQTGCNRFRLACFRVSDQKQKQSIVGDICFYSALIQLWKSPILVWRRWKLICSSRTPNVTINVHVIQNTAHRPTTQASYAIDSGTTK